MNYYNQVTQLKKNSKKNFILKLGIVLFLFLFGTIAHSQTTQFQWAKKMGNSGADEGLSIDVDEEGNVYTTGVFNDTVDFNPNAGIYNLTGGRFIQKLDAGGNLIWAKGMGGIPTAIFLDDSSNIYTTGFFSDTVDFDPNAGVYNLVAENSSVDIFVQKMDSAGNFIWAKRMGGTGTDIGNSIVVDKLGNVYTTGYFELTVDFDPNAGIYNLPGGSVGAFIQKLDAGGNFVWAKSLTSLGWVRGHDIDLGASGYVYVVGEFENTVDFDPNAGTSYLTAINGYDCFIQKLDTAGNFIWAKNTSPTDYRISDNGYSIAVDEEENVYTTGRFEYTVDFDPNMGTSYLTAIGDYDVFIQKLDSAGNLIWVKGMGSSGDDFGRGLDIDGSGNIYTTGHFEGTVDFDPGPNISNLTSMGIEDIFIQKLDFNGNFLWAKSMGDFSYDYGNDIVVDASGNVHTTGLFLFTVDFDPNVDTANLTTVGALFSDIFIQKLSQKNISGRVYIDFNQNCVQDNNEIDLLGRRLIINPGNIIVTTQNGNWHLDSLPIGNYTLQIDTSGPWKPTCSSVQSFTVVHPDSLLIAPSFGMLSTNDCPAPDISIHAPFLRPGFTNQRVMVQACNQNIGTGTLDSAYVIVTLDSLLIVQGASLPFSSLGNNQYRINVDTIYPNFCVDFWLECQLSVSATLGQSLCMSAELFPIYSCSLDTLPNQVTNTCLTPYDDSHISIKGACSNDSIQFIVYNTGSGSMTCFSEVRLYIDGQYIWVDSVQLQNGQTKTFVFSGDGRTWRLEVDQHPLHPGNSQPSQTIELCGNAANWTPNLVNLLPQNDADPVVDIYCGLVTGSYDPNDKKGYPLGIGNTYDILPNQDLEYLIRFQNTGTDTAFTVVIRDTLSEDLDIFSIRSGASSHDYSFRIYGPRILEWTFNTIMLVDSNANEPASHGFVKFKVKQKADLPIGTEITNKAAIYFDFNTPIITNTYLHTINIPQGLNWDGEDTLVVATCDSFSFMGLTYMTTGTYLYPVYNNSLDSLYTINLTILNPTSTIVSLNSCNSYTAPDGQVYTSNGQYTAIVPNSVGCDSTITINLTIKDSSSSVISVNPCSSYTAPDGQVYTSSGQYTAIIPNSVGCDSTITINVTIKNSSSTISVNPCSSYTAPDGQVYTSSGQYTAIIPNSVGCDSTITINVTIKNSSSAISVNPCSSYTAPDGQVYTSSGQYTAIVPNSVGCDSTITINVSIDSMPDNSVTQNGFTLTSNTIGFDYQWLDCNNGNTPITGETNQSYTATINGDYAVMITNGSCIVTSNCINITGVIVEPLEKEIGLQVYPNPATTVLYFSKDNDDEINIDIIDNLGRILISKKLKKRITEVSLEKLSPGIYYLFMNNKKQSVIQKIVKQ